MFRLDDMWRFGLEQCGVDWVGITARTERVKSGGLVGAGIVNGIFGGGVFGVVVEILMVGMTWEEIFLLKILMLSMEMLELPICGIS